MSAGVPPEILRQVKQHGSCYARDRFLDEHLGTTTEEETASWRQGFCERAGLAVTRALRRVVPPSVESSWPSREINPSVTARSGI